MAKLPLPIGKNQFGLTVLGEAGNQGRYRIVSVQCECGKVFTARMSNIRNGNTKSCGCRNARVLREKATTHGKYKSKIYSIWHAMHNRCNRPNVKEYKYYGAKGIKVCPEWSDFNTFYAEMGDKPEGHSLDRIDRLGDYSKENCRWATQTQQMQNTSLTRYVTINGERQCVAEWSRRYNMRYRTILERLNKGWDEALAVTTPTRRIRL